MSSKRAWLPAANIVLSIAASGCSMTSDPANVGYGDGTPVGSWTPEEPGDGASGSGANAVPNEYGSAGGPPGVLQPSDGAADTQAGSAGAHAPAGGSAGGAATTPEPPQQSTGGQSGAGTASAGGSTDAGSGGSTRAGAGGVGGASGAASAGGSGGSGGGGQGPTPSVSSLTFDVTTSAVGYRYQPKNIGAIWVQDDSGKLVKSLEVWAGVRRRYLTHYASALSGASVDVTASATLSTHRTHHASWDMRDKSGALVAPGTYTLVMELTDGDATGLTNSVSFDTSAGATTLSPTDAPSFSGMKLQLQ